MHNLVIILAFTKLQLGLFEFNLENSRSADGCSTNFKKVVFNFGELLLEGGLYQLDHQELK